ncbi:MAG: SEC-C metal-binding domain-containing protein [Halanaerobiales bacterium]|nr:SEC-C metal-binding domain-containing protein [Halanaerobiales bacterium]
MILLKTTVKIVFEDEVLEPIKSYKIPRNEPCPCGSGKKFKKCCGKITPEKPITYYLDKLEPLFNNFNGSDNIDLAKYFEIIKKADQDYPVEPIFSEMAGVISYHLNKFDQSAKYLTKYYNIVQTDLEMEFLLYLIDSLNQINEFEKSEEILEKMINIYNNHEINLLMTEVKLALDKTEEGYEYGLECYKKSDYNLNVLNLILNVFFEYKLIVKIIPLVADNYHKLKNLKEEQKIYFNFIEDLIEIVFLTKDPSTLKNKEKANYLEIIAKILEIVNSTDGLIQHNYNKMNEMISDEYDLSFLLLRLFETLQKYEWIVENEEILMELADNQDILHDFFIEANYKSGNYNSVIDNLYEIYEFNFLNSSDHFIIRDYTKYYVKSLYYMKDDHKIKKLLSFLTKNLNNDTLNFILSSIDNENYINTLNLLEYLKSVDEDNMINTENLLEIILSFIVRKNLKYADKDTLVKEDYKKIVEYLDEYSSYNNKSFIYHFTNWLLNKVEEKSYDIPLKEIIKKDCNHLFSVELKYLVILKYLDPKIIINNPPDKEFIEENNLTFFKDIAKFINRDIEDYVELLDTYPNNYLRINLILNDILTNTEKETLY